MYEEELGRVVGSRIYSGDKLESEDIISELHDKGIERILDGDIYISTSGNKPILAFNAEEEQFKPITNLANEEVDEYIEKMMRAVKFTGQFKSVDDEPAVSIHYAATDDTAYNAADEIKLTLFNSDEAVQSLVDFIFTPWFDSEDDRSYLYLDGNFNCSDILVDGQLRVDGNTTLNGLTVDDAAEFNAQCIFNSTVNLNGEIYIDNASFWIGGYEFNFNYPDLFDNPYLALDGDFYGISLNSIVVNEAYFSRTSGIANDNQLTEHFNPRCIFDGNDDLMISKTSHLYCQRDDDDRYYYETYHYSDDYGIAKGIMWGINASDISQTTGNYYLLEFGDSGITLDKVDRQQQGFSFSNILEIGTSNNGGNQSSTLQIFKDTYGSEVFNINLKGQKANTNYTFSLISLDNDAFLDIFKKNKKNGPDNGLYLLLSSMNISVGAEKNANYYENKINLFRNVSGNYEIMDITMNDGGDFIPFLSFDGDIIADVRHIDDDSQVIRNEILLKNTSIEIGDRVNGELSVITSYDRQTHHKFIIGATGNFLELVKNSNYGVSFIYTEDLGDEDWCTSIFGLEGTNQKIMYLRNQEIALEDPNANPFIQLTRPDNDWETTLIKTTEGDILFELEGTRCIRFGEDVGPGDINIFTLGIALSHLEAFAFGTDGESDYARLDRLSVGAPITYSTEYKSNGNKEDNAITEGFNRLPDIGDYITSDGQGGYTSTVGKLRQLFNLSIIAGASLNNSLFRITKANIVDNNNFEYALTSMYLDSNGNVTAWGYFYINVNGGQILVIDFEDNL